MKQYECIDVVILTLGSFAYVSGYMIVSNALWCVGNSDDCVPFIMYTVINVHKLHVIRRA
jgi:hypothetical protein